MRYTGRVSTLRRWSVEGLVFALLLPTFAYFYQSAEHNEAARFDQLRTVVEDGTLYVNRWARNTADLVGVVQDGERRLYPNKAPGATLLALPAFSLWRWLLDAREEPARWHAVAWLTTLSSVGLLSALAAVATCRLLRRLTRRSAVAAAATLALWLATPLFPFSTLFFSHALAAALLALAVCVVASGLRTTGRQRGVRLGAAGLALGFAAITEYPTVLLGSVIGGWALLRIWQRHAGWQPALALLGGGLLGLLPMVAYNLVAFGEPFVIAYAAYAEEAKPGFPVYARGVFGLEWPGLEGYLRAGRTLLFDAGIGLVHFRAEDGWAFATSPVLLLAVPGVLALWRRRGNRGAAVAITLACAAYLTFNACYGTGAYDWGGGGRFGPRHLVPLVPLLAVPLALGLRRWPWAFAALALPSAFYMLVGTAVQPRVPMTVPSAARDLHLPLYLEGRFGTSGAELFDLERRPVVGDAMAWNVAEVLGVPGTWQLAPLLGWWLLVGIALLVRTGVTRRHPRRAALAALSAAGLATAVALAPVIAVATAAPKPEGRGLMGAWYRTPDWTGQPTRRLDPEIDFDWSRSPPRSFSVEWTGSIEIERRGGYWFTLISDDGSRLWIDGRLVVDNGGAHAPVERTGHVRLEPGRHRVRLLYFNGLSGGMIRLSWVPPGLPPEPVPTHVLFPD